MEKISKLGSRKWTRPIFMIALFYLSSSMLEPHPKRIIFFGDSITEAGAKPGGFITRLDESILKKRLAEKYELIGAGVGGNKVYDLYLRMDSDVLAKNPDMVVIWIGVNDVWHKQLTGTGTDADKFEKFYSAIIRKLQSRNIQIVLCTPAVIGEKTDCTNPQDGDLNKYAQIIRGLSANYGCRLIDLRKIFLAYDLKNNPDNKEFGILTQDRVHLTSLGNQLVADSLEGIFDGK
jgi:isoamyl acetate esterase